MSRVCKRFPRVSNANHKLIDLEFSEDSILLSTYLSKWRDTLAIYSMVNR